MLKVDGLDVDINGTPILRDIGLEIESGEIVGLIGRNGAGSLNTILVLIIGRLDLLLHLQQQDMVPMLFKVWLFLWKQQQYLL